MEVGEKGEYITIAKNIHCYHQSSGAVSKSRWPSRAPVPNKPTVSVDVKQHSTNFTDSELRSCVKVEVNVLGSHP